MQSHYYFKRIFIIDMGHLVSQSALTCHWYLSCF